MYSMCQGILFCSFPALPNAELRSSKYKRFILVLFTPTCKLFNTFIMQDYSIKITQLP